MTSPLNASDIDAGKISRKIFSDPEIFQDEMEKVFARSWLFLAHESQIPETGDFFTTYMGSDPVIVIRQADGSVEVLLNSCSHRGMKVCRADSGKAKSFTCTYHGWVYGDDGKLLGVPFEDECYGDSMPKDRLGLGAVTRVENYKGFIFGCWDEAAPQFLDYLGDMTYYFDILADRVAGGTEVVGGVFKWTMRGNWKLAAEQFAGDMYHGQTSHVSAMIADVQAYGDNTPPDEGTAALLSMEGFQISPGGGHGVGAFERPPGVQAGRMSDSDSVAAYMNNTESEMEQRLGAHRAHDAFWVHNNIFPNFSWLNSNGTVRVWHPKDAETIEVWMWCLVDSEAPADVKRDKRLDMQRHFGPSGTWEQDDGENWNYCAGAGGAIQRRRSLEYSAGIGMSREHPEFPGEIGGVYSEINQRNFYRRWNEFMSADSWNEISVPVRTVPARIEESHRAREGAGS